MSKINLNDKLSKKSTVIVLVSILVFVLIAMVAIAAGHNVYLDNQKAQITNVSDFRLINPQMLIYVYPDEDTSVDFNKIIQVNKKATFSLVKIIDEDGTVSPPQSSVVSVSEKPTRDVVVRVKSPSKTKTVDYRITLVSKALSGNVINAQIGDAILNGEILSNYSGLNDVVLPTPTKTYTSPDGDELNYTFLGWYTSADYQEGTEISEIKAGTSGEINLYPKFAPPAPYRDAKDGFVYVAFGNYPQSKVSDYNLLKTIRASAEYAAVGNNTRFTYGGQEYYKFKPNNQPNLAENGYSSSSYYVFKIEPVWWRVLTVKNGAVSNGTVYRLLSRNILSCSAFNTADDGWVEKQYTKYASQLNGDLTSFIRRYFDPDTVYKESTLRSTIGSVYSFVTTGVSTSNVRPRTFTAYKNALSSDTETYTDNSYALNYSEMKTASFGFNDNWEETDTARQASATDFAMANGVYVSNNKAYMGKGSWWLRGSGTTFDYNDKKIAYVKYTGKLHSYTAASFSLRSGVRPTIDVTSWFAVAAA